MTCTSSPMACPARDRRKSRSRWPGCARRVRRSRPARPLLSNSKVRRCRAASICDGNLSDSIAFCAPILQLTPTSRTSRTSRKLSRRSPKIGGRLSMRCSRPTVDYDIFSIITGDVGRTVRTKHVIITQRGIVRGASSVEETPQGQDTGRIYIHCSADAFMKRGFRSEN